MERERLVLNYGKRRLVLNYRKETVSPKHMESNNFIIKNKKG